MSNMVTINKHNTHKIYEDSKESLIYFKNEMGLFSPFGHGHTCGIFVPWTRDLNPSTLMQSPNH